MAPNRMTAYQNARAATPPQKGLTYSELLMDNLIGLDNDYLSAGERLGQQFNADPLGFLKGAGISAYEGAKGAVTSPIETIQGVGDAIYGSGEDLFRGIDSKVQEMFGVGYDDATDEQVTQAREALVGDVLNVGSLAPGLGAGVKGLASLPFRGERRAQKRIAELEAFQREAELGARRDAELDARNNDDFEDPGDDYFEAQNRRLAQEAPIRDLLTREAEGADLNQYERERVEAYRLNQQRQQQLPQDFGPTIEEMLPADPEVRPQRYLDDVFPGILARAQRGEPLSEEEAFDVMTYERFGEDGVYDPTNTFENWLQGTGGDTEGAARIAFLTDPTNPQGLAEPVARQPGPYFDDGAPFDVDVDDDVWADDDWDVELNAALGIPRPSPRGADNSFEVRPSIGQAEGIAGLYSPTRKAVDLLDRPAYDNLDSLRVQLINRGAKPDELARLTGRLPGGPVSKDDLARFADEASQDVVVSTRNLRNSPVDNPVYLDGSYFLKGAEDMGANVFEAPVGTNAPGTAFEHFRPSADGRAPVLHTRFGMFRSPGADKPDTYHLGEIQSDWAQTRQKLYPNREEYTAAGDKIDELIAKSDELEWERTPLARTFEGETPEQLDKRVKRFRELSAEIARLNTERSALSGKMDNTESYGTRDEFDANYPAPYVGTTSKWVQLGLRQSLLDAVNKGAKRMTLSTGEQAKSYTFGKEGGQNKFYDEIVPKELEAVLKKFAKEAGIQKPEITTSKIVGSRGQEYMVPTVEFTDEFVEALKRVGLPAYAKGGIVKGSYLDNDPLEPALY
jgi:hypothetical protein